MIPAIFLGKAVRRAWKPLAALGAGWFIARRTSERFRRAEKLLLAAGVVGGAYLLRNKLKGWL